MCIRSSSDWFLKIILGGDPSIFIYGSPHIIFIFRIMKNIWKNKKYNIKIIIFFFRIEKKNIEYIFKKIEEIINIILKNS